MARHKHVININDIEEKEIAVEEKFSPCGEGARQLDGRG